MMVLDMRKNCLALLCIAGLAFAQAPPATPPEAPAKAPAPAPAPAQVPEPPRAPLRVGQMHSVYLLGMAYGLDQHLAQYLVRLGVCQVTTDPKAADAVLTDSLGPGFEVRFRQLFAAPKDASDAPSEDEDAAVKVRKEEKERAKQEEEWNAIRSTWGRGRGNVYLVDRYSKAVVYTMYAPPKNSSRPEVDKAAKKIAEDLLKKIKSKG